MRKLLILGIVALAVTVYAEVPWPWNAEMGTSGQCLISGGTGVPPSWGDCGGEAGGSIPSGAIVLSLTTCPTGFSEVSALSGKFVLGTVAANDDVADTGGSDSITPTGTNTNGAVNAHSGTAVDDHASHTHTYTQVPNHVHPYCSQTATTGSVASYEHGAIDTSSAKTECSQTTENPTGGVATGTTAGPSATLTHNVTQPANHSFTQPTFTGNQFDNRPAYVKVIFCEAD